MCAGMPEVLLTQMFPKVGPAELGFALGWGQSTVGELSIKVSGEIRTVNLPEKLNPEKKKFSTIGKPQINVPPPGGVRLSRPARCRNG